MQFSRNYPHRKHFFSRRKILTKRVAELYILEESLLIFLTVILIYKILGMRFIDKTVVFFQNPFMPQNFLWLFGSIAFFLIGYFVIVLRDETVWSIHKGFSKTLFGSTKQKVIGLDRQKLVFVFGEMAFASMLALSIFIYLDPDVNILPASTPKIVNYIGFAIMAGIALLLFSHTKEFRDLVYGPTPVQRRIHQGREETRRFTYAHTGSIRIASKRHYRKKRFLK